MLRLIHYALHAVAIPPAGSLETDFSSVLLQSTSTFPTLQLGRLLHYIFRGPPTFTRVTTCRLAKSPYATFYIGGSGGFVAPPPLSSYRVGSDPVPGRVYLPLWSSAFHWRTAIGDVCAPG